MDLGRRRRYDRLDGFPRTRGDGPDRFNYVSQNDRVSPHSRGWTSARDHMREPGRGFPALAGMDRVEKGTAATAHGFPRTRGDGPARFDSASLALKVSPHSRGWTSDSQLASLRSSGFPALAGMDLRLWDGIYVLTGFPRTRGDGPQRLDRVLAGEVVSPHSRGWTGVPPVCWILPCSVPSIGGSTMSTMSERVRVVGEPAVCLTDRLLKCLMGTCRQSPSGQTC